MPRKRDETRSPDLGFERTLFRAADKLRSDMEAAEYKHVVLGLVFLKFVSEYCDTQRFQVPPEARFSYVLTESKTAPPGPMLDAAMSALEAENPALRGILPKDYGRAALLPEKLRELVALVDGLGFERGEGRSKDILGRVYEYFLGAFAAAEGRRGGQYYTPASVVRLLVEMLCPYEGSVYDPCCGTGGIFVQSELFTRQHGSHEAQIRVFGQESNLSTWRLAKMNLAIRGIKADLGPENADSLVRDLFPDLKADFIISNPPFNAKDWGSAQQRVASRFPFGIPPASNANFAWVTHFIQHLAPRGFAGFVLANGSLSSSASGEGAIRRAIVEADLVDCMVALPPQLFYSTQISACLWFLAREKSGGKFRDRRGEILFIDASKLGQMISRTERALSDAEISQLAATYHAFRGDSGSDPYADKPGYHKRVTLDEVRAQQHVLIPGRYVGAFDNNNPKESFATSFPKLLTTLEQQMAESERLSVVLRDVLHRFVKNGNE